MPYTNADIPEVKARLQKTYPWVGDKAARQFIAVFNSALARSNDEGTAFSTAYGVLKKQGYRRREELGGVVRHQLLKASDWERFCRDGALRQLGQWGIPRSSVTFWEDADGFYIGAPAPLVEAVRAAVEASRNDYVIITEGKASPGAIGEGWYIRIKETTPDLTALGAVASIVPRLEKWRSANLASGGTRYTVDAAGLRYTLHPYATYIGRTRVNAYQPAVEMPDGKILGIRPDGTTFNMVAGQRDAAVYRQPAAAAKAARLHANRRSQDALGDAFGYITVGPQGPLRGLMSSGLSSIFGDDRWLDEVPEGPVDYDPLSADPELDPSAVNQWHQGTQDFRSMQMISQLPPGQLQNLQSALQPGGHLYMADPQTITQWSQGAGIPAANMLAMRTWMYDYPAFGGRFNGRQESFAFGAAIPILKKWTRHLASPPERPYDSYTYSYGGTDYVLQVYPETGKGWIASGLTSSGYAFSLTKGADPVSPGSPDVWVFNTSNAARKAVKKYVKEGAWTPEDSSGVQSEIEIEDGPSEFLTALPSSTAPRMPENLQSGTQESPYRDDVVVEAPEKPSGRPPRGGSTRPVARPGGRKPGRGGAAKFQTMHRDPSGSLGIPPVAKGIGAGAMVGGVALLAALGLLLARR